MIVFATIFGVGFLVLILSMIFGHDTDIDMDAHVGDLDSGTSGPSIFSPKMIALLMVGFGAFGFGYRATTDASMFHSSMAGIGGAAILGIVGYLIIRAFYASQESSTISDNDIIGQHANIIDEIQKDSNGQVACVIRGREITFLARTADGSGIAKGHPVRIISKTGNVVTVEIL